MGDDRLRIHDDAARATLGDPAEQNVCGGDPDTAVLDAASNAVATSRGVALAQARLGYAAGLSGRAATLFRGVRAEIPRTPTSGAARARGWRAGGGDLHLDASTGDLRRVRSFRSGEWRINVQAFDDVLFPLVLGREVEAPPEVSTAILTSAGGHEARNAAWAQARTRYDVGPGVRSDADYSRYYSLFARIRARMGPARAFLLRDPFDDRSNDDGAPAATAGFSFDVVARFRRGFVERELR